MTKLRGILAGLVVTAAVTGCDVGSTIEAANQTGQDVLARITVQACDDGFRRAGYVVIVPAKRRLFIAQQPFTCPRVQRVEILTAGCDPIADFDGIGTGVIFIDDGPRAALVAQQAYGAVTAQRTDACPGDVPPFPSPSAPS